MYYSKHSNPYQNDKLNSHIKDHLPMDEFAHGNFSQGFKILEVYREYLLICLGKATQAYIGNAPDITTYLRKELGNLEKQHHELSAQKAEIVKKIKVLQFHRKDLKEEYKDDEIWQVIFKKFEEREFEKEGFEYFLSNFQHQDAEKNKQIQDTYAKFIHSPHYKNFQGKIGTETLYQLISERNDITLKLSHQGNSSNIQQEINAIKTGKERQSIEKYINEEMEKMLRKRDHLREIVDDRTLRDMFISILATQLITHPSADKKLKKDLIRNHSDKGGLFHHIRNIYTGYPRSLHILHNPHHDASEQSDIKEQSIKSLCTTAREILEKIPRVSYFWMKDISKEDWIKNKEHIGSGGRRKQIIHMWVSHLESMLKGGKTCTWSALHDEQLNKLFEGISDIKDDHEFEDLCGEVRDIDFRDTWEILKMDGKILLQQIYACMSPKEREDLQHDYQGRKMFEDIQQKVSQLEQQKKEQQLLLFDVLKKTIIA